MIDTTIRGMQPRDPASDMYACMCPCAFSQSGKHVRDYGAEEESVKRTLRVSLISGESVLRGVVKLRLLHKRARARAHTYTRATNTEAC